MTTDLGLWISACVEYGAATFHVPEDVPRASALLEYFAITLLNLQRWHAAELIQVCHEYNAGQDEGSVEATPLDRGLRALYHSGLTGCEDGEESYSLTHFVRTQAVLQLLLRFCEWGSWISLNEFRTLSEYVFPEVRSFLTSNGFEIQPCSEPCRCANVVVDNFDSAILPYVNITAPEAETQARAFAAHLSQHMPAHLHLRRCRPTIALNPDPKS